MDSNPMKIGMKRTISLILISLAFPLFGAIPGNLELTVLEEEINQAILDVRDAKASRWPTIELEINGSWMENPPIGPITVSSDELAPAFGLPAPPITNYITVYDGMESTLYDFSLNITQPLFTWGKINASVEAQEAIADAKFQERRNREQELSVEIATRAVTLTELEAIIQLLEQQYDLGRELVSLSREAVASGMMLELEQLETELKLQDLELALLESKYSSTEQTLKLHSLTSNRDFSAYTYNEKAIKELLRVPLETLVDESLSPRHASLQALTALKKATQAAEKLAKGSFYGKPDLALVVSAGYSGPRFPFVETDWYGQDDYDFTISVGLKTTLFDGGKIANSIKRAKSQEQTATIELQQARERIAQEVQEQYVFLKTAIQKIDLEQRKQITLQRRIETNEELYHSGYGNQQEVIQAKMNLLSSRIAEHQLKIEAWSAFQTLQYLTRN
jgi:outer membrane protein TolC